MAVDIKKQDQKLGEILKAIDEALLKSDQVLDDFYDMEITNFKDENGNLMSIDDVQGDKLDFIRTQYRLGVIDGSSSDKEFSKFEADLKNKVKKSDNFKSDAKKLSEDFLKYKTTLLEYNDKQIEILSKAIEGFEKQDADLANEISSLEEEIKGLEEDEKKTDSNIKRNENQINKLESEITTLEAEEKVNSDRLQEINDEIADLNSLLASETDPDKIKEYNDKISSLTDEKDDINEKQDKVQEQISEAYTNKKSAIARLDKHKDNKDKISKNLTNKRNLLATKQNEKNNLDLAGKKKELQDLRDHNKALYLSFDKDFDTLDEKLGKYGMKLEDLNLSRDSDPQDKDNDSQDNKDKDKDKEKKNAAAGGAQVLTQAQNPNSDLQSPVPLTSRLIAKNVYDEFMSLTASEQGEILTGDGYNDLMNAIPDLNLLEKWRLKNAVESKRHALGTIKSADYDEISNELAAMGIDITGLKGKLFDNYRSDEGKFVGLDNLNKKSMIELSNVLALIEERRPEMSPELLSKLDKNIINFIKYDTLSYNVRFFAKFKNIFNTETNKARKGIMGSVANLTSANANTVREEINHINRNNSLRLQLGQDVNPPTVPPVARRLGKPSPTLTDKTR